MTIYLPLFIPIMNTTVCKLLTKDIYNTEIFDSISCTLSIYLSTYIYISIYHPFFKSILLKLLQTQLQANYCSRISTKLKFSTQPHALSLSIFLSVLHSVRDDDAWAGKMNKNCPQKFIFT